MKKISFIIITLLVLGNIACSSSRNFVGTKTDKTVINYSRTISSAQATQILQLMRDQLAGFPTDDIPIKYENDTKDSTLRIHLKKNKVRLNYRSTLNLNKENQEVTTVHQLKETIAAL